jgi:hypothetical protein
MKRLQTYLALFLVYLFLPGAHEATENLVHVVVHGDLAHAGQDGRHRAPGAEHDCTVLFHACPCHTSVSVTLPAPSVKPSAHPPRRGGLRGLGSARLAAGYPDQLYRPPIV